MRVVVLGYIVRGPLGGLAWHHLQYVLGLKQLGYEVLFLEDSDDFAGCYNPETFEISENPAFGLNFLNQLFSRYGLKDNWAYFDAHANSWHGKTRMEVLSFCSLADIVLNVSGVNPVREWWAGIPSRILIDTDPAFTQIKHLTSKEGFETAKCHTDFFSFGENIGKSFCSIPSDGFEWKPTRQPVCLELWKSASVSADAKWTTVMQWDSYKVMEYGDQSFGMKSRSFKDFESLPSLLKHDRFELALGSVSAPVEEIRQKGWQVISSLVPTKTPWTYQEYIAASKGEWTIAKHGYVTSKSGWFSERTLCYMASGKPVAVQDTGLSQLLETGKGLFVFNTIEEAVENITRINGDYHYHCRAARNLVEDSFASEKVLNEMIERIG